MLVDTSVWIDFFNGTNSSETRLLKKFLEGEELIFTIPIILQEILQGIREDIQYNEVKQSVLDLEILTLDSIEAAIGAADLYRTLRKKGITIKKSNDSLIAYYAIYFNVELLHKDSDFDLIARYSKLKIVNI